MLGEGRKEKKDALCIQITRVHFFRINDQEEYLLCHFRSEEDMWVIVSLLIWYKDIFNNI